VKTTVDIDDQLLRRAKSHAAARGITLKQFLTEAIAARLRRPPKAEGRPAWMTLSGALAPLRVETARIQRLIDEEFEQIDAEDDA
jgi:hypothetical protein